MTATEQMKALRDRGWLVVLKATPKECSYVLEGSHSEYDAPCPAARVGKGLWCCEASWMREAWRPSEYALAKTARHAVSKVAALCSLADAKGIVRRWTKERRKY